MVEFILRWGDGDYIMDICEVEEGNYAVYMSRPDDTFQKTRACATSKEVIEDILDLVNLPVKVKSGNSCNIFTSYGNLYRYFDHCLA